MVAMEIRKKSRFQLSWQLLLRRKMLNIKIMNLIHVHCHRKIELIGKALFEKNR